MLPCRRELIWRCKRLFKMRPFFAIHLKAFSGTTCSCLWLLVCQLWATKVAQKLPRGSQLEPKSVQTGALNPALWLTCASVPLWCLQSSRTGLEIVPNDGQHVMISIRKGTSNLKVFNEHPAFAYDIPSATVLCTTLLPDSL